MPSYDEVVRALAPDGPSAMLEQASIVTVTRVVVYPGGKSERSVYRQTKAAGSVRTDLIAPVAMSSLVNENGDLWRLIGGTWVKLSSGGGASSSTLAVASRQTSDGAPMPTVEWVDPPHVVRLVTTLSGGIRQEEIYDLAKRVQIGRKHWSAHQELLLDEQWRERRWHGQRWLESRLINNPLVPATISETNVWEWPGLAKGKALLNHVP